MVNVPTGLNHLKTKVDDLNIGQLKTALINLKKLIDVVNKEAVKNTTLNKLITKVNKLDKKIADVATLIHINQYNTDKQSLVKKMNILIKIPDVSGLVTTNVLNTKIGNVENKIPVFSGLVTITVLNTKIKEVENKIPNVSGLVKKTYYDAKILDIEKKYFTTSYYKFT